MSGSNEEKCEEKSANSTFCKFCITISSTSFAILVGFHFSVINPIAPSLQLLFNETYMRRYNETLPYPTWINLLTLSASSLIICAFIAAITSKFLLNFLSSKRLMQIAHVTNLVSVAIISLGSGLTGSYEVFIAGRFLSGYVCGICYVLIPAFSVEMSKHSEQGVWQSAFGTAISFGLLLGPVIGHPEVLGSPTLIPILFSLASIPSILYLVASLKFPQTPYYLVRAGKKLEAMKVLLKIRKGSEDAINKELRSIEKEINTSASAIGIHQIITTRQYRNQLFGVLFLLGNLMLCGANNIGLYSSLVFTEAGISPDNAALATIGIFVGQFVAACVGTKVVSRFGGVRICIISNIILFSSLILFTITKLTYHLSPSVVPYISIFSVAVFLMIWAGGTNIASFVVIGEITIEPTRVTCMTYGNMVLWITSWLVGYLPPHLTVLLGNYSMLPWIICGIVGMLYMCICLPNTKGKSKQEIQRRLSSKISLSSMRSTTPLQE